MINILILTVRREMMLKLMIKFLLIFFSFFFPYNPPYIASPKIGFDFPFQKKSRKKLPWWDKLNFHKKNK